MDRVVLDTDASSLSLKHRLPPSILTRVIGKQPCVTFVTLGELTQWAELRRWGRRHRDGFEHLLRRANTPPPPPRPHPPVAPALSLPLAPRRRSPPYAP